MDENKCSSYGFAEELLKNRKVADPATHVPAEVNFLVCQNQKEASTQIVIVKEWLLLLLLLPKGQLWPKDSDNSVFFFCHATVGEVSKCNGVGEHCQDPGQELEGIQLGVTILFVKSGKFACLGKFSLRMSVPMTVGGAYLLDPMKKAS